MSDTAQLEANKKLAREYVVWHGGGLGDITGVAGLVGLLDSFMIQVGAFDPPWAA